MEVALPWLLSGFMFLPVWAQEKTPLPPAEPRGKVEFEVGLDLAFGYESPEIHEAWIWTPGGVNFVGIRPFNHDDYLVNGPVWVKLTADVSEHAQIVLSVRIAPYGDLNHAQEAGGDDPILDRLNWGGSGGVSPFSNTSNHGGGLQVHEAYAVFGKLFDHDITLFIGATSATFDLRGRGNVIFLDAHRAENPFPDAERAWGTTVRVDSQPVGAKVTAIVGDFVFDLGLFPVALEQISSSGVGGGAYAIDSFSTSSDAGVYYMSAIFQFDERASRAGLVLAAFHGAFPEDNVYTFGGGLVFVPHESVELFAEGYLQFGRAWSTGRPPYVFGGPGNAHNKDGEASGRAFQLGARLEFRGDLRISAELDIIWIGGNDMNGGADFSNANGFTTLGADECREFMSYESNNRLVIMDSSQWGFDWDNNILQIVAEVGIGVTTREDMPNNLYVGLIAGYGHAPEEWVVAHPQDGLLTLEVYGVEVDLTVRYSFSNKAAIYTTLAYLLSSEMLEAFTTDGLRDGYVILIGTRLTN